MPVVPASSFLNSDLISRIDLRNSIPIPPPVFRLIDACEKTQVYEKKSSSGGHFSASRSGSTVKSRFM